MATFLKPSEPQPESILVNLDLVKHIVVDRSGKPTIGFIFDKGYSAIWNYTDTKAFEKDLTALQGLALAIDEHSPYRLQ